eukprot:COSAG02_NODE_62_length_43372_cov_14.404710_22_plen_134_part_00
MRWAQDVNDTHDYPWPLGPAAKRPGPTPSASQYAMLGEMGGMGTFVPGHMWAPSMAGTSSSMNKGCFSYGHSFANTSAKQAEAYMWIVWVESPLDLSLLYLPLHQLSSCICSACSITFCTAEVEMEWVLLYDV